MRNTQFGFCPFRYKVYSAYIPYIGTVVLTGKVSLFPFVLCGSTVFTVKEGEFFFSF